jgi:hypothetical protein
LSNLFYAFDIYDLNAISTSLLALATLGGRNTNRNDPICVAPPKVAMASKGCDIAGIIAGVIALNFANGNTA